MKTGAEQTSTTTSRTVAQTTSQSFFPKAGEGGFFKPSAQSSLFMEGDKLKFRQANGQVVELPSEVSIFEAINIEKEARAAEQKLGKRPPPVPVPDVKKLANPLPKKETQKPSGKAKKLGAGKGKAMASSAAAAVAGLKSVGKSKAAQYLATKGTPALVKGVGMLQKLRQHEQTHDDASEKLTQSEKAVVIPSSENQSKSNAGQVTTVSDRPPPVANDNKGKQKLQISLVEHVPQTIEDVDNFKRNKKGQHIGSDVLKVVQADKTEVQSAFNEVEQTPPPAPPEHLPENLPPEEMAPVTPVMNLAQGAVVPLQKEHTDVSNYTKEADGKLKEEGVTQEQLDMVDSGDLAEANKEKKGMETKAKTEPLAVDNFVQQSATRIDQELKQEEKKERDGIKAKRKVGLNATAHKQKGTKSALEKKREEVANKINGIYTKAQNSVKKKLADLETVSMKRFDEGNAKATKEFEDNVNREIDAFKDDRYSGFFGWARKVKDWIKGMDDLPEVKAIFDRNRAAFVSAINKLVEDITADNKRVIQECKDELAAAKQEIKDYVDKLGPDLKDIGRKSADEMNAKLAEMDGFIAKKEQELQDKLKDKQQAAIKAIDEKIEKMKEAMAGALAKLGKLLLWAAKKFFTWALEKFGFSLSDIESIINKGATVLKAIFTKPIAFVKNLINAALDGFKNFGKNFLKHLQDSLFEWLTGALEGLVLPSTWDLKGIISVALQMVGISYQAIRKHLVTAIGEPAVANLEKTFTLVKTLITEGPMAAWEQIKEMAGEMRSAFEAAVKDFIKSKIIEQAIQWVASIFIPGAGIVKAIIGIYDTVMFFIQKAKTIMQMVGNFLSSVGDIAAGNIGAAADALENGLKRGLTLVISFLAALLRLSGITNKIKEAIGKIRDKVDAVLAKVAKWIADKARKLVGSIAQAGVPQDPVERLRLGLQAAIQAANRFANRRVGKLVLLPLLNAIKLRFGLTKLEPVPNGRFWRIVAVINPQAFMDSNAELEEQPEGAHEAYIQQLLGLRNQGGEEIEVSPGRYYGKALANTLNQVSTKLLSEDVDERKLAIDQIRGDDKIWTVLQGMIYAPFVTEQLRAVKTLQREVDEDTIVYGLERGGARVAEQVAARSEAEVVTIQKIKVPQIQKDKSVRMVTSKSKQVAALKQKIIADLSSDPLQRTTVVITETMVGGGSTDALIELVNDIVRSRQFPNVRWKLVALQQTLQTDDAAGVVEVRHRKIARPNKIKLIVASIPYILGEDVGYQTNREHASSKSPVILFKPTDDRMYAYQIIPIGKTTAADIIADLVAGKYNGRLPNVL